MHQGLAVFPLGGRAHMAAQQMHHQLAAIANAQHGHAQLKQFLGVGGRIRQIGTVGAAGEDDALGVLLFQILQAGPIGHDLAVHVAFPHTTGNQLIVLAAEIHHNDSFSLHASSS